MYSMLDICNDAIISPHLKSDTHFAHYIFQTTSTILCPHILGLNRFHLVTSFYFETIKKVGALEKTFRSIFRAHPAQTK